MSAALSKNVAWVLGGNVLYALSQWALLAVLARLGGAPMVGAYAYALALTTPVFLFSNLQLRMAVATDALRRHTLPAYFRLRSITSAVAFSALALTSLAESPPMGAVILSLALMKSAEAFGDIVQGEFQRADRMDFMAWSLGARAVLSVPAVALGTWLSGSLSVGLLVAGALQLTLFVIVDIPFTVRAGTPRSAWRSSVSRTDLVQMARTALPLGVALALVALASNIPRYFLERTHGLSSVGIHAAILQFVAGLAFLLSALGETSVPAMARALSAGEVSGFDRATRRLVWAATLLAAGGVLFALVLGRPALDVLFGPAFGEHSHSLVLALGSSVIHLVASAFCFALTAARRFREQVRLMLPACAVSAVASWALVPRLGIDGAILAYAASSAAIAMGAWVRLGAARSEASRS